jgi:ADP-ribose pyrophosphatase
MEHEIPPEVHFDERVVHTGRLLQVITTSVRLENGTVAHLDQVKHPGAAAIVPLDAAGKVILVRQRRYATGLALLEIPAGKRDPQESPEACAHRELEEETGHRAGRLRPLGAIWTTPGFCNERIHLYLATDLQQTHQALDVDEFLTVERLPLRIAVQQAETGAIDDAKSVCALLRAAAVLR